MRAMLSGLAALGLAVGAAAPAFASYSESEAGLQCTGNSIVLRFGRSDSGGEPAFYALPAPREAEWRAVPFSSDKRCTLANGARVEMHTGTGQSYGWGAGGGDPDKFFSLWIDGRKVIAKEKFYVGYDGPGPSLHSLFVTGNSIERCVFISQDRWRDHDNPGDFACTKKGIDIAALPVDALLPNSAERTQVGTITFAATYNPAFCASFISAQPGGNGIGVQQLRVPADAKPFLAQSYEPKPGEPYDYVSAHAQVDHFDLWNSGQIGTAVRVSDYMKFFVGDVVFYRDRPASEEDIKAMREQGGGLSGRGDPTRTASELGWLMAGVETDGDPYPHTYREFFRLGDSTYLLERLAFRRVATLYRPQTNPGRGPSFETVCAFKWVEEYF